MRTCIINCFFEVSKKDFIDTEVLKTALFERAGKTDETTNGKTLRKKNNIDNKTVNKNLLYLTFKSVL